MPKRDPSMHVVTLIIGAAMFHSIRHFANRALQIEGWGTRYDASDAAHGS